MTESRDVHEAPNCSGLLLFALPMLYGLVLRLMGPLQLVRLRGDGPSVASAACIGYFREQEPASDGGAARQPRRCARADLEKMVSAGQFRADLSYRLKVFRIVVPPLRERHEDILPLARIFLREVAGRESHDSPGVVHPIEHADRIRSGARRGYLLHLEHLLQAGVVEDVADARPGMDEAESLAGGV